jgi:hypothetical protein
MIASVRPEIDFLRQNSGLLKNARARRDVAVFLPCRQWTATADCRALQLARNLAALNLQFEVVNEDELAGALDLRRTPIFLIESQSVLTAAENGLVEKFHSGGGRVLIADTKNWLARLGKLVEQPSVRVTGPPTIRVVVRDQPAKTIVHVLNLNVHRLSSFQDSVTPATKVSLELRVPFEKVHTVQAISADPEATQGTLAFTSTPASSGSVLKLEVPRIEVATMLIIQ